MTDEELFDAKIIEAGNLLVHYIHVVKKKDKDKALNHLNYLHKLRESKGSHPDWDSYHASLASCKDSMLTLLSRFVLADNLLKIMRIDGAIKYSLFLHKVRDMNEKSAREYVIHLLDLNEGVELHREANVANDNINRNDKRDYPHPPTKAKTVCESATQESTSDDRTLLNLCKLSTAVNKKSMEHKEKVDKASPLEKLKMMDDSIFDRINNLYYQLISAESVIEMNVLSDSIEKIIRKRKMAIEQVREFAEAFENG